MRINEVIKIKENFHQDGVDFSKGEIYIIHNIDSNGYIIFGKIPCRNGGHEGSNCSCGNRKGHWFISNSKLNNLCPATIPEVIGLLKEKKMVRV